MLNCFAGEGIVSSEIDTSMDAFKKTQKTTFHIENTQTIGKKTIVNKFYVVVYGKLAEKCAHFLKKGMPVRVQGQVSVWNKDEKDGVVINASQVYWYYN